MKAWLLDKPAPVETQPLRWGDVPDPKPRVGEILVRVRACAVCRTDLHVVEGELEARKTPVIPGHQIVGEIVGVGEGVDRAEIGRRVGVAWLHHACGTCPPCQAERENLCDAPEFTGWTVDGGYAELVRAPAAFCYPIPEAFGDLEAAPLLCAGIIGYRALKLTSLDSRAGGWRGARLGLYGFGAAGHVALQLARARGAEVFVATRDRERHQALARELGAAWVGDAGETPPAPLDAAVIFAPAGELVPAALAALEKGSTLVLGGIHMSAIPSLEYRLLYGERVVRSVANNTRADGHEFLEEAARVGVLTHVRRFPLREANEALAALKNDAFRGAAVLEQNGG